MARVARVIAGSWGSGDKLILMANVRQERERSYQTRCCARDGGRPSEAGLQEQASNSRKLRWSRAIVVSVTEKGVINHVM
jgi:hypothetical protein